MPRLFSMAQSLCLGVSVVAFSVQAHEVVEARQTTRLSVTQVVVAGDAGGAYVMKTLQPLDAELVVVTSAMARSAKPFALVRDQFEPVASTESLYPIEEQTPDLPKIKPGLREAYAHYFNHVYDVVYEKNGQWMRVQTLDAPVDGKLVLTDEVKRASKAL